MVQIGAQQGWKCPQCGYIYAPQAMECYNCNRPDNEKYKTTDGTEIIKFVAECTCSSISGKKYCPVHSNPITTF